jgi:hypothetical protein
MAAEAGIAQAQATAALSHPPPGIPPLTSLQNAQSLIPGNLCLLQKMPPCEVASFRAERKVEIVVLGTGLPRL